jgi:cytochrome c oxidase assembly protein subunit 15
MSTVSPFLRHARPAAPVRPSSSERAIAAWLLVCCVLVFAVIVVGGITRLSHAGLSITEWQPIVGTLPPLSAADWEDAFAKYRATPEYQQVNRGMTLDAFKRIYWWEYVHRLLGRLVGVAFIVPLAVFAWRRRIPEGLVWKLAGVFVLGGLQGALGWYMVKSGLVDDPRVSQFRLTAHLTLAFLILGALLWLALSLLYPKRTRLLAQAVSARRWSHATLACVLAMVVTGGFVAGLRAGKAYNTFPLMNGELVPSGIMMIDPWWKNFFWNIATVQFDHRMLALLLLIVVVVLLWKVRAAMDLPRRARSTARLLGALVVLQVALGVSTLLLAVPLVLGTLHQAGAALVFATSVALVHALR